MMMHLEMWDDSCFLSLIHRLSNPNKGNETISRLSWESSWNYSFNAKLVEPDRLVGAAKLQLNFSHVRFLTALNGCPDVIVRFSLQLHIWYIFPFMSLFWIFWLPRQELHIAWQESKFFSNQMNQTKHFISRCNPSPFQSLSLLLFLLVHLLLLKSSAELFGRFSFFFVFYVITVIALIQKSGNVQRDLFVIRWFYCYMSAWLWQIFFGFFFLWKRLCRALFFSYWSRMRERNRCILYRTIIQHCTDSDRGICVCIMLSFI